MANTIDTSGLIYTPKTTNAVYEDESSKDVSIDNFLSLMVAQLQNQDPMNPMEDTDYVTQLAQFATMQQMQQLAYYSQSNYVMSMVGKEVTVARSKVGGSIETFTGPVEKISLVDNEYLIYVDGKTFTLDQVMEVHPGTSTGGSGESGTVDSKYGLALVETKDGAATFVWEVPTQEDNADAARLRYSIYYSTKSDFDTVEDIKEHGTLYGEADQTGINEATISGLTSGSTYYVNVVVKDTDGSEKAYKKQVVVMP